MGHTKKKVEMQLSYSQGWGRILFFITIPMIIVVCQFPVLDLNLKHLYKNFILKTKKSVICKAENLKTEDSTEANLTNLLQSTNN